MHLFARRCTKELLILAIVALSVIACVVYFSHAAQKRIVAQFEKHADALNKETPLLVNQDLALYLTGVRVSDGSGVRFNYIFMGRDKSQFTQADLADSKQMFLDGYCENQFKKSFERAGGVTFRYVDRNNEEVLVLRPRPKDCVRRPLRGYGTEL